MRHNSCTVIVLASPAPAEVLGTVGRSMNVTLVRPAEPDASDGASGVGGASGPAAPQRLAAAADALHRAAGTPSAYALVTADPLAAVADGWRAMWDLAQPQGPGRFEQEASAALAAWRSHPSCPTAPWSPPAPPRAPPRLASRAAPRPGPSRPRPASWSRTSTWARCGPPARTGWPSCLPPSPRSRPPACCRYRRAAPRPVVARTGRAHRRGPHVLPRPLLPDRRHPRRRR